MLFRHYLTCERWHTFEFCIVFFIEHDINYFSFLVLYLFSVMNLTSVSTKAKKNTVVVAAESTSTSATSRGQVAGSSSPPASKPSTASARVTTFVAATSEISSGSRSTVALHRVYLPGQVVIGPAACPDHPRCQWCTWLLQKAALSSWKWRRSRTWSSKTAAAYYDSARENWYDDSELFGTNNPLIIKRASKWLKGIAFTGREKMTFRSKVEWIRHRRRRMTNLITYRNEEGCRSDFLFYIVCVCCSMSEIV